MKHVTALDNPLNGFADGEDDLGIFVLSPGAIRIKNYAPEQVGSYFWLLSQNQFIGNQEVFYDPGK